MKKLLQISIVLVLALALIVGLFQIGIGSELPTAGNPHPCRVGWNTRKGSCLALGSGVGGTIYMPNAGWNS